jgi:hypothetical protein
VLREALPRGARPLAVGKSLADFRAALSEEALASVDALLVCGVVRACKHKHAHALARTWRGARQAPHVGVAPVAPHALC